MEIWRIKSRTGSLVHLTENKKETLCGYSIKDDWKFLYLLKDREEALEHSENLCDKCNLENLNRWEEEDEQGKEIIDDEGSRREDNERGGKSKEVEPAKPVEPKGLGTW